MHAGLHSQLHTMNPASKIPLHIHSPIAQHPYFLSYVACFRLYTPSAGVGK